MPAISAALDLDDTSGQVPDDSLEDLLAKCPELADDAWLAAHDPDWADDAGWTARPGGLAGDAWPDGDDPDGADDPDPGPREVLKAGFWDRSAGDGAGFAAGGVLDTLPPGPALAGFARDAWADGLGRLSDDELVGVLRAARRLASWAGALELAAGRRYTITPTEYPS